MDTTADREIEKNITIIIIAIKPTSLLNKETDANFEINKNE